MHQNNLDKLKMHMTHYQMLRKEQNMIDKEKVAFTHNLKVVRDLDLALKIPVDLVSKTFLEGKQQETCLIREIHFQKLGRTFHCCWK